MMTSSVDAAHTPLLMDQRRMFCPSDNPDTVLLGVVALEKNPEPVTTVQTPIPTTGVLLESVADVIQIV